MKVFTNRSFYCDHCKIGYNHRIEHKCKNLCKMCNRVTCRVTQKIKCEFCNIFCNEKKCLDLHQSKICKNSTVCDKCFKCKSRHHICEHQKYCKNCLKGVD